VKREVYARNRLPPQRALGLMWLTLACECGSEESWTKESYNPAMAEASECDRAMALQVLALGAGPLTESC
jgi:hypothetical protein